MKIHNKCTATLIDSMGDDLRVANVARVSFNKWKSDMDPSDARLIHYLAEHQHWTPFSHVMATLRIEAPIFLARQWFKSQMGVTRNEMSRRYVDDAPEFYIPDEFHARPEKGIKQGSGEVFESNDVLTFVAHQSCYHDAARYETLIKSGLAPEEARMFLPQNTMTAWVETGSLAYYARVCKLRLDSHAQRGIQQLAAEVAGIVENVAPVSWAALMGENK